jgi:tetratricopeptide (TPR) repeat protein
MTVLPESLSPAEVDAVNAQASVLMKRGISLMGEGRAETVAEALCCFDQALDMRLGLPIKRAPILAYGLAACWLNRADALLRLGGAERLELALRSYDEGIALIRSIPLADDPRFPRRLAIALQNRGLALLAFGSNEVAGGIDAFNDAIALLDSDDAAAIPDRPYLTAAVLTNLAMAHAAAGAYQSATDAHDAAVRAIALAAPLEKDDVEAAEVGLKARHVLCQTIAGRLAPAPLGGGPMPDDVHEATDLADEGLTLIRGWEQKGVTPFRAMAHDLFRFGARVYKLYQPQFLSEFIFENLDPSRSSQDYVNSVEVRSAAFEAFGMLEK